MGAVSRSRLRIRDQVEVRLPVDNERITINIQGKDERAPRRMRITKKDLGRFGFTVGRAGWRAANRGSTAVGHTEECRKRIVEELEKAGDERVERERETERFYERLEEEEENKRRKPRQRRRSGGIKQTAASSSAGGGPELRSCGGVSL